MTLVISTIFLSVALGLLILGLSGLISVAGGAQFVSTPPGLFHVILALAQLSPGEHFTELGSGRGMLCAYVCKHGSSLAEGVDISLPLVLFARLRHRGIPGLTFRCANLYTTNLKKTSTVYCYLLPHIMKRLEKKFEQELRHGARVIAYCFPLPNRKPSETFQRTTQYGPFYVYEY
ncbi:hypothetical protein HYW32_01360 [Candidatus Berkelbacteria bacterium]|nr:hypothetical protein [Candidatus Berkelbacteria bacterium]